MAIHAERPPVARALPRPVAARARSGGRAVRVGPWTQRECRALAVLHVLALAVIVLAYWKSSGQAHPADQLTWLNLSVVAMLVAGGADALFFARGHRTAARVRRAVFVVAPAAGADVATGYVALEGARRYHAPGCSFVAGKAVTDAAPSVHEAAGRVPCEVCRPGEGA